jgi:hypothetical protein
MLSQNCAHCWKATQIQLADPGRAPLLPTGAPAAKALTGSDATVGAQRHVAAAQQDTGASIDQLTALAESLTA